MANTITASTGTATNCYTYANVAWNKWDETYNCLTLDTPNCWTVNSIIEPLNKFNQFGATLSDCFTACKNVNFLKQVDLRLGSFAGAFDALGAVGVAFWRQNSLYQSFIGLTNFASCAELGKNISTLCKHLFDFKAPDEVQYNNLQGNLTAPAY